MAVTDAELKQLSKVMGSHRSEVSVDFIFFAKDQLLSDKCLELSDDGIWLATEKGQRLLSQMLSK